MHLYNDLCIVPARKNSKRLPNKNFLDLGGKPLVFHTLDTVTRVFDHVLFTTDSKALLDLVLKKYRNIDWQLRPPSLATDTSKVIDTVKSLYDSFNESKFTHKNIWLTLPTCPFRTITHLTECKDILEKDWWEKVVSITDFDFPPSLSLNKNIMSGIQSTCPSAPWERGHSRSQDHRACFRPNGAIYGCKWEHFKGNWYTGEDSTYGYYMLPEHSIDIDTKLDLKFAEFLLNEQKN